MGATLRITDRTLTLAAFVLGLATISGALGSQYFGGLYPCELCLEQRWAYYIGLPVVAIILLLRSRLPRGAWLVAMAGAALIFLWGAYMGGYHAGVEWGFWPGPTACSGTGTSVTGNVLEQLNAARRIVRCDEVQFRFLGLTLAFYNMVISLAIAALLGAAMVLRGRGKAA
jgi:disulfide bond formation protein DsbB